jgi:hypothetical protein
MKYVNSKGISKNVSYRDWINLKKLRKYARTTVNLIF